MFYVSFFNIICAYPYANSQIYDKIVSDVVGNFFGNICNKYYSNIIKFKLESQNDVEHCVYYKKNRNERGINIS